MPYSRAAVAGMVVCALLAFLGLNLLQGESSESLGASFMTSFTAATIVIAALGYR